MQLDVRDKEFIQNFDGETCWKMVKILKRCKDNFEDRK
jgi:hypothetical protein